MGKGLFVPWCKSQDRADPSRARILRLRGRLTTCWFNGAQPRKDSGSPTGQGRVSTMPYGQSDSSLCWGIGRGGEWGISSNPRVGSRMLLSSEQQSLKPKQMASLPDGCGLPTPGPTGYTRSSALSSPQYTPRKWSQTWLSCTHPASSWEPYSPSTANSHKVLHSQGPWKSQSQIHKHFSPLSQLSPLARLSILRCTQGTLCHPAEQGEKWIFMLSPAKPRPSQS